MHTAPRVLCPPPGWHSGCLIHIPTGAAALSHLVHLALLSFLWNTKVPAGGLGILCSTRQGWVLLANGSKHHCLAEQVHGRAAPLQRVVQGAVQLLGLGLWAGASPVRWALAGPMPFSMVGRMPPYSLLLPLPYRTQTGGQWVMHQKAQLCDRSHYVENHPSPRMSKSNSLCLVYTSLIALPVGSSVPVQIDFGFLNPCWPISGSFWDPWPRRQDEFVYGYSINQQHLLVKIPTSWRTGIFSHKFSLRGACRNSPPMIGRH